MKDILQSTTYALMLLLFCCCMGGTQEQEASTEEEEVPLFQENMANKVAEMNTSLCANIPAELIMSYHPYGKQIETEKMKGSGLDRGCLIKVRYGKKEHNFVQGQVQAWAVKTSNPFFQYKPERNPSAYQKVDGLGEKAVYLAYQRQLLVLKERVMYSMVPPSTGKLSDNGKEIKDLAIAMAKHYKL